MKVVVMVVVRTIRPRRDDDEWCAVAVLLRKGTDMESVRMDISFSCFAHVRRMEEDSSVKRRNQRAETDATATLTHNKGGITYVLFGPK